jgi:hypothetical protein
VAEKLRFNAYLNLNVSKHFSNIRGDIPSVGDRDDHDSLNRSFEFNEDLLFFE